MANIKEINIADLIPDDKNFNKGTEYGGHLLEKSFDKFGAGRSILLDKNNRIIAGNKATEKYGAQGGERVIVVETDGTTMVAVKRTDVDLDSKKGREMALADNATQKADLEWDLEELKDTTDDWDIDPQDWGVGMDWAEEEEEPEEIEEDDFDPNADIESRVSAGDVWQLGEHRLMCGDSTSADDLGKLMGEDVADLVFTDPPYGMKKEADGVLNDNLNYDALLQFNKEWIPLTFGALKENGSWYCWGIDEPLMDIYSHILKPMIRTNGITFRNYITWAKHAAFGVNSDSMRCFPRETEKCLFVMKGVQGFNNNKDHYDETFEPIRAYMEREAKKVSLTPKMVKEITGVQMYSHWFTKSQFVIIPENHYLKLQAHFKGDAFGLDYNELSALFDDGKHKGLKDAIMAKRAYFNNTHNGDGKDIMTDVWRFSVTGAKEREDCGGHATPKPLELCARGIKSNSREGEIVLDVFGGSGSTMMACEQLNRRCYMMELDPHYCDVILTRWEKMTGKKAERIQ